LTSKHFKQVHIFNILLSEMRGTFLEVVLL